jgi:hypothetical protein
MRALKKLMLTLIWACSIYLIICSIYFVIGSAAFESSPTIWNAILYGLLITPFIGASLQLLHWTKLLDEWRSWVKACVWVVACAVSYIPILLSQLVFTWSDSAYDDIGLIVIYIVAAMSVWLFDKLFSYGRNT